MSSDPPDSKDPSPPPGEVSLPDPDIQDGDGSPTYRSEIDPETERRREEGKRNHPLASFRARPPGGSGSAGSCLLLGSTLALVGVVFLLVAVGWAGPGRFVHRGYEVVRLTESPARISEAPTGPTCYIGRKIDLRIPKCPHPIAVIGTEVHVSGDYLRDASFTVFRLTASKRAGFARELEIYGGEFRDEGATLLGDRRGFVFRDNSPEKPKPES